MRAAFASENDAITMLRICYVGASHMVAHKLAYDARPAAGIDISFRGLAGLEFVAIGAGERGIGVDRSMLRLPNMNKPFWPDLKARIDYAPYDGFVVAAPIKTGDVLRPFRLIAAGNPQYSAGYLLAMARGIVETDHGMTLAAEIARRARKPVVYVAAPLPALPARETVRDPEPPYRAMEALLRAFSAERGIALVMQPEATLEQYERTHRKFAVGSVAYDGRAHPREERVHMNAAYGALVLADVLQAMDSAIDPSTEAVASARPLP